MEQRNLVLAIILSIFILLGFQLIVLPYMFPEQQAGQERETTPEGVPIPPSAEAPAGAPIPLGEIETGVTAPPSELDRGEILTQAPRVTIQTPALSGSISLVGGRIDDLVLTRYRETLEEDSDEIVLLSPPGTTNPYFAGFGWTAGPGDVDLPGADTIWRANGEILTPDRPLTLTWDNGRGLRFEQVYEVDENYMFTVTQRVANMSERTVDLRPYGFISRTGTPDILGFYILHEGPLGVFDGTLEEIDYSDLQDDGPVQKKNTVGWLGITDKYWLVALVPDQDKPVDTRFVHSASGGDDKYQADYLYEGITIRPGVTVESRSRLFTGAKVVTLLDSYRDDLGIENFDLSVDFGWFYFLTKPLFYALHYINGLVGNFGVAILILTVGVKLLFFPLANKSYVSMAKMRKLQPEMLVLRERFKDDKQRLNQEMMGLYKREGANPASGCLPVVVQIPVFFALYKVMFVTIEMRQAPFFGWIQDLSAPDPSSFLNGFGLLPWEVPELGAFAMINLGVWPLLMGLSMFAQQRLNPQPPDPIQAKIFLFMPIMFTFLLARFPAGLVIYWTWNNLLSISQQYVIMKRAGAPIGRKANQKAGKPASQPAGQKAGQKAGPKTGGKADPKADEKTDEKADEKADPKAGRKSGKKARAKSGQKSGQKSGEKSGQTSGQKSGRKARKKAGTKAGKT
ncbi:MAG: membrane protein insertase YidC [Proteobacteria bacterium]|nr:membrane protein insertase YidC [Pseudomonadota bacterium]